MRVRTKRILKWLFSVLNSQDIFNAVFSLCNIGLWVMFKSQRRRNMLKGTNYNVLFWSKNVKFSKGINEKKETTI